MKDYFVWLITANNKNVNVQYLRGICAFIVFFSHALGVYKSDILHYLRFSPFHFFYDGQIAVMIFFVLSGYYYRRNTKEHMKDVVKDYIKLIERKVVRIYPAHIISLILGVMFCTYWLREDRDVSLFTSWFGKFWTIPVTTKDFLCSCTIFLPHNSDLINPPIWYLTIEVQMMVIMPLFVIFFNKTSWFLSIPFLAIISVIKIPYMPYLFSFLVGATFNYFTFNHSYKKSRTYLVSIAILGCFLLNVRNLFQLDMDCPAYIYSIQSIGALCVLFFFLNVEIKNKLKALLLIGNISYEIYIIHFIVLLALSQYIKNYYIYIFISLVISLVIAFFLSYLSNIIFKRTSCRKSMAYAKSTTK